MESFAEKVEEKIEEIVEEAKKEIEEVIHPQVVAGNTTVTLAPTAASEVAAPAATVKPVKTEYAGKPKDNLAPQAKNAQGKSRYAADGLTIDWFDTHPRK